MRSRWAARVAESGDQARTWAIAATAVAGLGGPGRVRQRRPGRPEPTLAAVPTAEPWQAEANWWRRVEHEGRGLLRSAATDSGPVLGAVVVMAADARRVQAALASAARGGGALEAYDAVV